jgi:hypothetical protein
MNPPAGMIGTSAPSAEDREVLFWIMTATGIVIAAYAIVLAFRVKKRVRESLTTTGRVIDTFESKRPDERPVFRLVVEYTDERNVMRTMTSRAASGGWETMVGSDVEVIYRRDDPADCRIHKWWVQWLIVTMWAGAALLAFAGSVLLLTLS